MFTNNTNKYGGSNIVNVRKSNCGPFLTEVKTLCKCDDVSALGDGSDIVGYVEAYKIEYGDTVTSTLIGTFEDETMLNEYTPVNTTDCCGGDDAEWKPLVYEGGNNDLWAPTLTTSQFTIWVKSPGVSYTDPNGNTVQLALNQTIGYGYSNGELINQNVLVQADATGSFLVTYVTL